MCAVSRSGMSIRPIHSIQSLPESLLDVADDLTRATESVKEDDVEASQPLRHSLKVSV